MKTVLDSSALLAVIFEEPGGQSVEPWVKGSLIGAVNMTEVVGKMIDQGWSDDDARRVLERFRVTVVPFDRDAAFEVGFLRNRTRNHGLSLGDRACLALAKAEGARVLTADRAWAGVGLGVEIEVIR